MDAVHMINERIDMVQLLEHYKFKEITINGNVARACCKLHDGDNPTSFVVNIDKKLWCCHAGCGGGDAFSLVQQLDGVTFPIAVKTLAKLFNVDIKNMEIKKNDTELEKELKKWLGVMKKRSTPIEYNNYTIQANVSSIRRLRNFTPETIKQFEVGYTEEILLFKKDGTQYPLRDRLVFPVYMNGKLLGVNLRRVKGTDEPKWSLQPRDFKYSEVLYNYDMAKNASEVVVVEGIYDVLAYYEIGVVAVACFGAHLSKSQYELLVKTGADITLSYDGDDAGLRANDTATKMLRNKVTLRKVTLPDGHDPEDISREELLKCWNERRKIK